MKLKSVFLSLVGLATSGLIAVAQTAAPAGDTNQPAASSATDLSAAGSNGVMQLTQMKDVALSTAIENLARTAELNYMLDPNIPFLKPGPDGRSQEPVVSIRLINVTADQALSALLNNYNLTIIEDPRTKISRITVKDPAAPEPLRTQIIQLKYADPTNMLANVQSVLQDKRSRVVSDVRSSQLVLVATEKEIAAVDELVARLDTSTKQVLIETKLYETSKNPTSIKGIDWAGTTQGQHVTFGNNVVGGQSGSPYSQTITQAPALGFGGGPPPTITTNGLINTITYGINNLVGSPGILASTAKGLDPGTAFLNADGLSAVLSFLNTAADAKVLSTPRAVTQDNHEAILSVTQTFPIFQTTAGTLGSLGGTTVTYTNIGTILHVTPRISANDTVSLNVMPEVSSFNSTVTKTVGGLINQADVFDVRSMQTKVLIPSGNTLVMGGLVNDNQTKGSTKVPILGDIPGLGWLFRQESKTQNKKNLIIFITPTIVHDEDFQPTQTDFLKTKYDDRPTADFGAWDSGNKQDWSKLTHKGSTPDGDDATK